jgi:hypothetical protein
MVELENLARPGAMVGMQTIDKTRRERLEILIKECGSIAALNEALGLDRTDSTLSQIRTQARHSRTGKPRVMGDDLARRIEAALHRPDGWMDTPVEPAADERTARVLELLGRLPQWQQDQVAKIVESFAGNLPTPAPLAGGETDNH